MHGMASRLHTIHNSVREKPNLKMERYVFVNTTQGGNNTNRPSFLLARVFATMTRTRVLRRIKVNNSERTKSEIGKVRVCKLQASNNTNILSFSYFRQSIATMTRSRDLRRGRSATSCYQHFVDLLDCSFECYIIIAFYLFAIAVCNFL